MSKLPKPISWSLRILLVATIIFVAYNLVYKEKNVQKIDQSNVATVQDPPPQPATEDQKPNELKASFVGKPPENVRGEMSIVMSGDKKVLSFSDSFSSDPGPDLQVYLSKNKVAAGENLGEFVSLQSLKNLKGGQTYALPDNVDEYKSVVIWCRAFNVAFGAADFK